MASLITRKLVWFTAMTERIQRTDSKTFHDVIGFADAVLAGYDREFPAIPTKSDADKTEGQ